MPRQSQDKTRGKLGQDRFAWGQVFRAPGIPFRSSYLKDLPVSVSWLPGSTATNGSGVFAENLNCSLGAGATYAPPDLATPVTLAECFTQCRADPKCDAVRVDWLSVPLDNWTKTEVRCGEKTAFPPGVLESVYVPSLSKSYTPSFSDENSKIVFSLRVVRRGRSVKV